MRALIVTLLFLFSCGPAPYVSPELKPYVESFERLYGQPIAVTVELGDLDTMVAGTCYYRPSMNRVVVSNIAYSLYKNDYLAIEQLVFHELGHCVMHKKDEQVQTEVVVDGIHHIKPQSMMYYGFFGPWWAYHKYRDEYVQGLFK